MSTPTVWELKTRRRTWTCDECGAEVDSVRWMRGKFVFCERHAAWTGWCRAWWRSVKRRDGYTSAA